MVAVLIVLSGCSNPMMKRFLDRDKPDDPVIPELPAFTVTFDSNGGTEPKPQTVEEGGMVSRPVDPGKDGFIFGGWYTDNDTFTEAWDFDHDTVTEDITLYAQWNESPSPPIGSKENPFLVASPADLQNVGKGAAGGEYEGWTLSAHYKQTNNIVDMSGIANWTPIGTSAGEFTGTYDGGGYTITNLNITGTGSIGGGDYRGLFGYINKDAAVTNVRLENVSITNGQYVGGVAGRNDGVVEYCSVSGNIEDSSLYSGGVVGVNGGTGMVRKCYATASVSGGSNSGGVVGYNFGTVENCYSTGDVSGSHAAGGVVGSNEGGTVWYCYATANISGGNYTGGIVGQVGAGTIANLVALNLGVTGTGTNPGRVRGGGSGSNLYARADMLVNNRTIGSNYADLTTIHGKNLLAEWQDSTWWRNASNGNGPGFSDTAWDFADNKLPVLKGFPAGTQNPEIKYE